MQEKETRNRKKEKKKNNVQEQARTTRRREWKIRSGQSRDIDPREPFNLCPTARARMKRRRPPARQRLPTIVADRQTPTRPKDHTPLLAPANHARPSLLFVRRLGPRRTWQVSFVVNNLTEVGGFLGRGRGKEGVEPTAGEGGSRGGGHVREEDGRESG